MNFNFDISLSTLVLSAVVCLVGWGLKAVAWAIIESIKTLVTTLVSTIAKVEILDSKMSELTHAVGDIQKMRTDVNEYYKRLKILEAYFKNPNGSNR